MSRPGERSFRQKTKEEKEKKLGQIACTFVINHIRDKSLFHYYVTSKLPIIRCFMKWLSVLGYKVGYAKLTGLNLIRSDQIQIESDLNRP